MNDSAERLPAWLGPTRLVWGLVQGLVLFWLHRAHEHEYWPATQPEIFGAVLLVVVFAPLIVIGGLNAIRPLTLTLWTLAASALLALMGWHELSTRVIESREVWPSSSYLPAAAIVFVGHHLVAGGDEARRWIAPYERYFDLGWRHGAQLVLSIGFVCAFWASMFLGAALFRVIGITAVEEVIRKDWFYFPATSVTLAAAVHLTDLRVGLVRGARALGLALLSWLGPVLTGLSAAFLVALPFTGLEPLWETRAAGAILLSAAAALIILINAAYQDGGESASKPAVLRWSARVAGVLITPLVLLATIALYLRVAQHGWSPERIYAAAMLLVGLLYAGFYLVAALLKPWMKRLELGNIITSFVVIAVLVALTTPLADPQRLSVDNQMGRLRSGAVSAEDFDLVFLRFESGRYGRDVFEQIRADRSSPEAVALAARAETIAQYRSQWQARYERDEVRRGRAADEPPGPRLTVLPAGAVLPQDFVAQLEAEDMVGPLMLCRRSREPCFARLMDVTRDGAPEVIVAGSYNGGVYRRSAEGVWRLAGTFNMRCPGVMAAMREGGFSTAPSEVDDLVIDGRRVSVDNDRGCDEEAEAETDLD